MPCKQLTWTSSTSYVDLYMDYANSTLPYALGKIALPKAM